MASATKIKRVKGGKAHYAAVASAAGVVTSWADSEEKAGLFDAKEAATIAEFYRERSNVGVLTFEPGGKPINDAVKATAEEKALAAKQEAERKAESQRIEVLIGKADRCDVLEREVQKLNGQCAALKLDVASLKSENEFLKKEIADTAAKAKAASEAAVKEQPKAEPVKPVEPVKPTTPPATQPQTQHSHHQGKAKA